MNAGGVQSSSIPQRKYAFDVTNDLKGFQQVASDVHQHFMA